MEKIRILDGLAITNISLGAGGRGNPALDETQFRIMDAYLALGGNCFDTARKYAEGACDASLGQYFKSRGNRNRVVLCTKGCHPADVNAMHIARLSAKEIEQDLDESLRAIGTDHTDLHLLHRDEPHIPVDEIVPALDRLVKSGKARAVGVSNWTAGRIQQANEFAAANGFAPISLCQIHFSLLQTTAAMTQDVTHVPMSDVEFAWYEQTRLPIMAFGNQGRGYFARKLAGEALRPGHRQYYDYFPENHRRTERLRKLAKELGRSAASVALAYVRDNKLNASALCGFSSTEQLMDSMQALEFRLSEEQVRYLETGK